MEAIEKNRLSSGASSHSAHSVAAVQPKHHRHLPFWIGIPAKIMEAACNLGMVVVLHEILRE